ncbi:FHA domain-containing protein [Nocardia sp. NPDC127579]|uniref:FHA domain-containing protein n=1 Tax=Nocardia sp. NPDC127579 TaxID=3345402 RepID=UPI0036253720
MVTCPDGHASESTDYCDECGTQIGVPTAAATAAATVCPVCDTPSSGSRFCEECGHDIVLGAPARQPDAPTAVVDPAPPPEPMVAATWIATISADRALYERVQARNGPDADRMAFPGYFPERRIVLRGSDILIGKHSISQGVNPDIDLGIPPVDAGVSRVHARLHLGPDSATVTDLGSTNGTSLNDSEDDIPREVAVPVRPGDRIHVGAWTTITLSRL